MTRMIYAHMLALKTISGGAGWPIFIGQFDVVPLGLWTGLGGLWLIVACGVAAMFLERRYVLAACYCAVLSLAIVSALALSDITRSAAYCLPAVFVALLVGARNMRTKAMEKLAIIAGVVCFLVPTYYIQGSTGVWWIYPLPVHVIRWISMAR